MTLMEEEGQAASSSSAAAGAMPVTPPKRPALPVTPPKHPALPVTPPKDQPAPATPPKHPPAKHLPYSVLEGTRLGLMDPDSASRFMDEARAAKEASLQTRARAPAPPKQSLQTL